MKRAVIYARFSSDLQREESIDAQVRACKEHIERRGYILTHIYADQAKSGKSTLKRDQYNAMLADAEEGLFDVVIMHKIDRNARNEFDYFTFKRVMMQNGISYEYAAQSIDLTPEGQMMEGMLVNFAAYYSRNLAKEVKKGMNENAYKAQFNGGTPPFGYDVDENKHYVINEHEAEGVRLIFDMYANGSSYSEIIGALNAKGFKTKNGIPFGKNSLFDILRNEKYIGTYKFNVVTKNPDGTRNTHTKESENVIVIENAIPPIIDKAVFMTIQEMRSHRHGCAQKQKAKRSYLLTGKIICGECGSAMNGHTTITRGKEYPRYSCTHKERTFCKCSTKSVNALLLEDWILEQIKEKILAPKSIEELGKKMEEYYLQETSASGSRLSDLKREQTDLTRKYNKTMEFIFEYGHNNKVAETLTEITDRLEEVEKLISVEENKKAQPLTKAQIAEVFAELKKAIEECHDIETRQTLISIFLHRVIVTNEKILAEISTRMFTTKWCRRPDSNRHERKPA